MALVHRKSYRAYKNHHHECLFTKNVFSLESNSRNRQCLLIILWNFPYSQQTSQVPAYDIQVLVFYRLATTLRKTSLHLRKLCAEKVSFPCLVIFLSIGGFATFKFSYAHSRWEDAAGRRGTEMRKFCFWNGSFLFLSVKRSCKQ